MRKQFKREKKETESKRGEEEKKRLSGLLIPKNNYHTGI